jgi:hypothetical protein
MPLLAPLVPAVASKLGCTLIDNLSGAKKGKYWCHLWCQGHSCHEQKTSNVQYCRHRNSLIFLHGIIAERKVSVPAADAAPATSHRWLVFCEAHDSLSTIIDPWNAQFLSYVTALGTFAFDTSLYTELWLARDSASSRDKGLARA